MSLISEALRAEMRRILDEAKEFDIKACMQLERAAKAAKAMIAATGGVDMAMQTLKEQQEGTYGDQQITMQTGPGGSSPLAPAPSAETFGVRAIQEFIKVLPALIAKKNAPSPVAVPDPLQLVRAIKEAKDAGLHDVAKALEERLMDEMAGEPDPDGPKPGDLVGPAPIEVATALPPAAPALQFVMPGVAPTPTSGAPLTIGEE